MRSQAETIFGEIAGTKASNEVIASAIDRAVKATAEVDPFRILSSLPVPRKLYRSAATWSKMDVLARQQYVEKLRRYDALESVVGDITDQLHEASPGSFFK